MKRILIACIVLLQSSCDLFHPKWVGGSTQPQKKEYHLSRELLKRSVLIDTASVYLNVGEWTLNGEPQVHTLYSFMRFSNNGTVFMSQWFKNKPDINDYNLMVGGEYGLYTVTGNTIKIETYNHGLRRFDYWYGDIKDDEINFYLSKGRMWSTGKSKLDQELYRKVTVRLSTPVLFPE